MTTHGARDVLVLGGTAWLTGEIAGQALAAGHRVTCLARGTRAAPPDGVRWLRGDRTDPDTLARAAGDDWDLVIDPSRQPGEVRTALGALGERATRWAFISTISVYAAGTSDDETAALLPAATEPELGIEQYGEGKVACELEVTQRLGPRAVIARLGLLGGPGDPSQRSTHWPHRWAESGDGAPVLLPDVPDTPVQVLDLRDAAAWLLRAGLDQGCHGAHDVAGPQLRFGQWQHLCREVTGSRADPITRDPDWLSQQGVAMWMGPRSLPLWLPSSDAWAMQRPCRRARAAGLVTRDPADTIGDILTTEPVATLGARAGLTRAEEQELLSTSCGPA